MQGRLNRGMEIPDEWRTWDTLAKRVRGRRKMLKLTQQQLADAASMNQGDISKIERGEIQQTTKVVQIARVLQCDPFWLGTGDGEVLRAVTARDLPKESVFEALTEAEKDMLTNYRTMLDEDREEVSTEIRRRAEKAQALFDRALRDRLGLQPGKAVTPEEAEAVYKRLLAESEAARLAPKRKVS